MDGSGSDFVQQLEEPCPRLGWPMDGKEEHEFRDPDKKPVSVCDVPMDQWLDIQKMTEGEMPVVWFQGKKRLAWLPRSRKPEEIAMPAEAM